MIDGNWGWVLSPLPQRRMTLRFQRAASDCARIIDARSPTTPECLSLAWSLAVHTTDLHGPRPEYVTALIYQRSPESCRPALLPLPPCRNYLGWFVLVAAIHSTSGLSEHVAL